MLKDIYNARRETIDEIIKKSIEKVKAKMNRIDSIEAEKNKELIDKIEDNYNIKLAEIIQDVYLQGLKDGIDLMLETKKI